MTLYMTV